MSVASLNEVSVAELAEVNGGLIPLLVGLVAMVAVAKGMKDCGPSDSPGITNFELLGITPPK
jgi:lactobin A/cerein 7B family class IIb bacteriocin